MLHNIIAKLQPSARTESLFVKCALISIAAILMLQAFLWMQHRIPEFRAQSTVNMVAGEATKPFVFRMLVPQVTGALNVVMPGQTADWARATFKQYAKMAKLKPKQVKKVLDRGDRFFRLRFITGGLMLLLLIGYGVALAKLGRRFFPSMAIATYVAPIIGFAIIPLGKWYAAYAYDPAVLCLAAWAFYAMLRSRHVAYIVLFALACLNKETALYLILIYALCAERSPSYLRMLSLQVVIYLAITIAIRMLYADNPGPMAEIHIGYYLTHAADVIPFNRMVILFAALFLVLYQWSDKPLMLRRSMWVISLALLVWMVFGRVNELRGLYDIYPYITLLLTHTMLSATQAHQARLFRHI